MNPCITTVAVGGEFPKLAKRLERRTKDVEPDVPVISWVDKYPPGSPTHQDSPFAFKPFAIEETAKRGHDVIIWADSRMYPIRPFQKMLNYIEETGWFFAPNGWNVGQWTKDAALKTLGITREEAFGIPDVVGGLFGLDLRHEKSREFLARLKVLATDGVTFPGPWTNKKGEASADKRVLGHRHDQVALSVLRVQMEMPWRYSTDDAWFFYPSKGQTPPESALFTL